MRPELHVCYLKVGNKCVVGRHEMCGEDLKHE